MDQTLRLWPTEMADNPARPDEVTGVEDASAEIESLLSSGHEASLEALDDKVLAEIAFRNPKLFRKLILENVVVPDKEKLDGKSFVCIWPTKFCPVGCDCCFFASPAKDAPYAQKNTITDTEGVDRTLQFLEDANVGELVVAGGGEPFLRKEFMMRLAKEAKADQIFFTTSGYWARSMSKARQVLRDMHENAEQNPHESKVDFRISLDKFHAAKLSPGGDLEYIMNLIQIFREEYMDEPGFTLGFHTMYEDETMEKVLSGLPVSDRERVDAKTEIITLSDGYSFQIRWKRLFYSDPKMDMNDAAAVERNTGIFDGDINAEHDGNMSVAFHDDEPTGLDWLVHYDGTALNWGAISPDNEKTIYTHNHAELVDNAKRDPVSLRFLERGNDDRNDIISEVNPRAVARAKAINLRDFYSRIVLEEDSTRLYLSIRALQEYLIEERISEQDMADWPVYIRDLVKLSPKDLQEGYAKSTHTIVHQYLDNPAATIDDMVYLYGLICKGHYNVTPEQMLYILDDSQFLMREEFRARVAEIHNEYPVVVERFACAVRKSQLSRLNPVEDASLLSSSDTVLLTLEELRANKDSMLSVLHPRLRPRFEAAFNFLLTTEDLNDVGPDEHEVMEGLVYTDKVGLKSGKGKEGVSPEMHVDHADIQIVVSEEPELLGLNSAGTATLDDAVDHPKREGLRLASNPDVWRPIGQGELMIILPMTPHAGRGIPETQKTKKLTVKVRMD